MAIGKAVQKGTLVYIYDEKGKQLTSISAAGCGSDDGLQGYTALAVNVRRGSLVYAYNEKGHLVGRMPVYQAHTAAA